MKKRFLLFAAGATLASGNAFAQFTDLQSSGMENWQDTTVSGSTFSSITLEAPDDWHGSDLLVASFADLANFAGLDLEPAQQIFKSDDSHSGQYAAEIRTQFLGDSIGNMTGAFSNAEFQLDINAILADSSIDESLTYVGGEPITGKVDSVRAWVKTDPGNTDNAAILAQAVKTYAGSNGDSVVVVGQGYITIAPSVSTYTEAMMALTYSDPNIVPDHLVVVFTSSDISVNSLTADNSLKVDDVAFSYEGPIGIWQPLFSENKLLVYPIPAKDLIYFNLNAQEDPAEYRVHITDIQGRVIAEKQLGSTINALAVTQWARGTYYYSLSHTKTGTTEQGKFTLR